MASNKLTATQTIAFSADAGGAPDPDDSDPVLAITLTTELKGVLTSSVAQCALCASLLIEFVVRSLCARARLVGVSPGGHAPLVLTEAGYWSSTCAYDGPDLDTWLVYSDSDYSPQAPGSILAISFPAENIVSYFTWPAPLIDWDPPLTEAEQAQLPTLTMALAALNNLDSYRDDGVQMPMRLWLKTDGQTGETALRELIYQDAPGIKGSGANVSCGLDPIFAVTAQEVAQSPATEEEGDYTLWWRIYKGSGDMVYRATCSDNGDETTLEGDFTDRRNSGPGGGFGTIETTDLLVARVRVEPQPWPYHLITNAYLALGPLDIDGTGTLRPHEGRQAGGSDWQGVDAQSRPVVLSWFQTGGDIFVGGRTLHTAPGGVVLAAGLRRIQPTPAVEATEQPPAIPAKPGGEALLYLFAPYQSSEVVLYQRLLYRGSSAVEVARFARLSETGAEKMTAGFAPDGSRVFWLVLPRLRDTLEETTNGKLYEAPITEEDSRVVLGAWAIAFAPPDAPTLFEASASATPIETLIAPLNTTGRPWTDPVQNSSAQCAYSSAYLLLLGASYSSEAALQWQTLTLTIEAEYSATAVATLTDTTLATAPDPPAGYPDGSIVGQGQMGRLITTTQLNNAVQRWSVAVDGTVVDASELTNTQSQPTIHTYPFYLKIWRYCRDVGGVQECLDPAEYGAPSFSEPGETMTPGDFVRHPYTRQRLGLKRLAQGRHGLLTLDLCGESTLATVVTRYPRIVVRDAQGRDVLRVEEPAAPELAALAWSAPAQVNTTAEAELALEAALIANLRLATSRRSTVNEATWLPYECVSRIAPDGASRLTALSYNRNDASWTGQWAHGIFGMGDDSTRQTLAELDNVASLGPYCITPRACLLAPDPDAQRPTGGAEDKPSTSALIAAHNSYRASLGLSQLQTNAALTQAIAGHVAWLFAQGGEATHTGEDGSTPLDRAVAAGYVGATVQVGENLALNWVDVATVVEAWKGSPGHHANMINPDWNEIGVAVLKAVGVGYWWGVAFGART